MVVNLIEGKDFRRKKELGNDAKKLSVNIYGIQ
jgi:hypothetical protein